MSELLYMLGKIMLLFLIILFFFIILPVLINQTFWPQNVYGKEYRRKIREERRRNKKQAHA